IYVASFILVSGFMIWLGKAPVWKALLTAAIFTAFMFYVFDVQFTVLMPKGPLEAAFGL
ncbi:MAG: tricarboxylate transporter, partial [Rhizobiales bacterium 35-66-30]